MVTAKTTSKSGKYLEAVGRRKTAVARVRLYPRGDKGRFTVNERDWTDYFVLPLARHRVLAPLKLLEAEKKFAVTVIADGGGLMAQADAVALGLSRALILNDPSARLPLKKAGFLTRDARAKERRKFGLKKARKAPQWSKR